jgi:glycosyltransferase involved in cell wall biosynthesis
MALGIPCITTSLANNAIKATDGFSIVVANTREEFILAIDKLLNNPEFYHQIGNEGRHFVKNNYSWKMACTSLKNILMNKHLNN